MLRLLSTNRDFSFIRAIVLKEYPPIIGANNSYTCDMNGCKASFSKTNPKGNYIRHVGIVHKIFQKLRKNHTQPDNHTQTQPEARPIVRPKIVTKRKASSQTPTPAPAPKKRKEDEPTPGTSGSQRRRRRISGPTKRPICQLCPKEFPNVSEFRRHLALSHFRWDLRKLLLNISC